MKITVLCENSVSLGLECPHNLKAEHGLSLFIEIDGVHILFDTAEAGQYKRNAETLGIDLQKTDFVVLSHNHDDHSGGLQFHNFQTKKTIVFHPQVLKDLPEKQVAKIQKDFKVITSKIPVEFTPNVIYLGEIPHTTTFEKGTNKHGKIIIDDSAIAIKTKKGVFVVTGCSHSGICNICEYAKKITGQKLLGVIGGFHLFHKYNLQAIKETINYFQKEKVEYLYPMHCIDFPAMTAIYQKIPFEKLGTGNMIEI